MIRHTLIGIPLDEVGDKLKALDKSLRERTVWHSKQIQEYTLTVAETR